LKNSSNWANQFDFKTIIPKWQQPLKVKTFGHRFSSAGINDTVASIF